MQTDVKEGSVIGGAVGVVLWLYDFRHILLGGPSKTSISDAIGSVIPVDFLCRTGIEGANLICEFLATLFILTFAGVFAGMAVARLLRLAKKEA
jgi:hypothetical protein